MNDLQRDYFFNKLIPYVDTKKELSEKCIFLRLIINSYQDSALTVLSELEIFLKKLCDEDDFESLYEYLKSYHNKQLVNEIISTSSSLNKKAGIFKEYFMARKYGYISNTLDAKKDAENVINSLASKGASDADIKAFEKLKETPFHLYHESINRSLVLIKQCKV